MSSTAIAARYRVRAAAAGEFETVGRLTFEGFGHNLPGRPQPTPGRRALLLDAAARARAGVRPRNERSQVLYRRFGFVRRPEREKPRPAPLVELVVFTLDLP
jgi:hypothetical protein